MLTTLTVAFLVFIFWLLYQYRFILFLLFVGVVLGSAMRPAVFSLSNRGFSKEFGALTIYAAILLTFLLTLFWLLPIILVQGADLAVEIPQIYNTLRSGLLTSPSLILARLAIYLPPTTSFFMETGEEADAIAQAVDLFQVSGAIAKGFLTLAAIFLLAYFWNLERDRILLSFSLMFSARKRPQVRDLIKAIEDRVGAFVRGQLILSIVIGGVAFLIYTLIGLPNSLVLAIVAGIFEVIPVIGPVLGAIPAILIGLSLGTESALWVIAAIFLIHALENYFLLPRIMGKSVGVNPILLLLTLTTLTSVGGLPGGVMAIPVAAVIQLLADRFLLSPSAMEEALPSGRDRISLLRFEAQQIAKDVRKKVRVKIDPSKQEADKIEDAIEAVAIELDRRLGLMEKDP